MIPTHYLPRIGPNYSTIHNTISNTVPQNLTNWIYTFKHYMHTKMTFAPTSMCKVAFFITPYFTGFI